MFKVQDPNVRASSNFLFENVNKILSTFVPANRRPEDFQLHEAINVKSNGTITFSDNKSNRAQFIRIPPDASVWHVKELMHRKWCTERPSLVISITGGAKDYNMKPRLLRAFRRGLLKVASTTGAWIITGGMNRGIMKLVGEIVQTNPNRSRPIHLIGIATWGCVSGFHQLDVHGANVHYVKPRAEERGQASLEPNHTEFIFVDDGSERKYGREITFRANLEQLISGDFFAARFTPALSSSLQPLPGTTSLRAEPTDPVPVVLLVVEGGPNTVRTVHEAVVQNNIPAVFIEGTGRCCDLFAEAIHLYNKYRAKIESSEANLHSDPATIQRHNDELKNKLREALKDKILEISGAGDAAGDGANKNPSKPAGSTGETKRREGDSTDYFELVYQCIEKRKNFLNVISLNARNPVEPDIDVAILKALLNATSGSESVVSDKQRKCEQFRLALEWNRADIVRNHIMIREEDWENRELTGLFEIALSRSQTDFVKLFLDHDFSLTDLFRDKTKLPLLYVNSMQDHHEISVNNDDPLRTIYQEMIQPLIGDFFEVDVALCTKTNTSDSLLDNEYLVACSCCTTPTRREDYQNQISAEDGTNLSAEAAHANSHMDVDKELFLWSVITGQRDLNFLFWARGKNKICAALIAVIVYRHLAHKNNDVRYNQSANEFENLAVEILDRFYQINARACTKAIIRQIPAYGNATWLELAIKAEAKQFIAQRAVQDVINNIWFGFIDQRENQMTIIFSTVMLWYSGFLRYHDELVKTNDQSTFLDDSLNKSNLLERNSTRKTTRSIEKPTDDIRLRLMHGVADQDHSPVGFVDVGCFETARSKVMKYFGNILRFLRAPYVKYLYSLYCHMAFLILFSYLILCDFFPLYDIDVATCGLSNDPGNTENTTKTHLSNKNGTELKATIPYGLQKHDQPAIQEYILLIWVSTLLCEELRQFFSGEAQSVRNKISAYFGVFWNQLDVVAILLFYVGFALRLLPSAECFCAARIALSVDLTLWFMRTLNIFAAIKRLGPKLVMIGEMVHDLKFFMLMLTVFILGFGVSSYSLIHGTKEFSWHLPREIINLAYWQMFGELNSLDTFENNYRANGYAVFILLVVYMAIVSILLVNLLIAMLSNTFDRLQTDTDRIWKFQRYELICEYLSRPSLPPPLILFSHLWRFGLYILSRCIGSPWLNALYDQHTKRTKYEIALDEKSATNIEIAEDALGDEVYYNFSKHGLQLIEEHELDEEQIASPQEGMLKKIRALENRVQLIGDQQNQVLDYLDCLMEGMKKMGGDSIRMPDRRHLELDEPIEDTMSHIGHPRRELRRESLIDEVYTPIVIPSNVAPTTSISSSQSAKTI
ncbi:unnamed protein product [Rotaria magnacalcarata]